MSDAISHDCYMQIYLLALATMNPKLCLSSARSFVYQHVRSKLKFEFDWMESFAWGCIQQYTLYLLGSQAVTLVYSMNVQTEHKECVDILVVSSHVARTKHGFGSFCRGERRNRGGHRGHRASRFLSWHSYLQFRVRSRFGQLLHVYRVLTHLGEDPQKCKNEPPPQPKTSSYAPELCMIWPRAMQF